MKKIKAAVLILDIILGLLLFYGIVKDISGKSQESDDSVSAVSMLENDVDKGNEDEEVKKIALTFDDGPHPYYTEELLDGLKKRGVHVSFFVTGEHAMLHPDVIKRMSEEGHLIGNHTYSHLQLKSSNHDKFREELIKTNDIIEEITGKEVIFVRPPYGSWDKAFEEELNMLPVLWNVDPLDWCSKNPDCVAKKVEEKAGENDIILLHDYYESSVTAALEIVDALLAEGYTFVTVDEIILE